MKTIFLCWTFITCAAIGETPKAQEQLYDDDLRFMTSIIPSYVVKGAGPETALEMLSYSAETVLGKGHGILFKIEPAGPGWGPGQVTLDLHNIPAPILIGYLAEIAACEWKYRHWPGKSILTFQPITKIDDTASFHEVQSFVLTPEASKHLGLRDAMSSTEVRELLGHYGVEFPKEANAFWNAKTHMLAVRNLAAENAVVAGLVRVANKGFEFVRSPAKEEAHKI